MKESILQGNKKGVCFLCERHTYTEKHHIFGGANRTKADDMGLFAHLCHFCHNEPPNGVHFNKQNNLELKRIGQETAMQYYGWTTEEFIKIFGKNYL